MITAVQQQALDATLAQGKAELDLSFDIAYQIGQEEALALGYVEIIKCISGIRNAGFSLATGSKGSIPLGVLHMTYEQCRPKGEDVPDPKSKVICEKLAMLEQITSFFQNRKTDFLKGWEAGFSSILSLATDSLIQGSIIRP